MTSLVFPDGSTALVKKHLSQSIIDQLEHLKTDSGFTLRQAVASGIKNPDSSIGIYAGDAQSYQTFLPIFDPIISAYHGGMTHKNIPREIAPIDLPDPDPEKKFIISTRIRVARNLKHFDFPCLINLIHRKAVEKKIIHALNHLPENLTGTYVSFENMPEDKRDDLQRNHLIFKKGDRFQDAAGLNTDFPKGRGVFHSFDKKLLVWVNEEDHLRIISMEKSNNLTLVFNRLVKALASLNSHLDFAWHNTYGHLASCPTNIGTAMRAGVHIRLKKLEQEKHLMMEIVKKYNLQIRGTAGEKTQVHHSVFDISNRQRLGISESDILKNFHKGILALIRAEKSLS